MRIETELRSAIKSAEKHQPQNQDWQRREKTEAEAIAEFKRTHQVAKASIARLVKESKAAADLAARLRKELCRRYGLRECGTRLATCGDKGGRARFIKAGGRLPKERKHWTTDQVIAELVAADPKDGDKILRKYGINWK